jgi:glycerophosphoryl diester phosphodiesterase
MPERPPIYAHRLGSGYGPESSRAALEGSLARDVDGLESDVVLSLDGEVFALHDPILSVSTDTEGWASETRAADLRRVRLRRESGEPSEEHPMTLRELLEAIPPHLPLQLDIKAYADHALARDTARRACEVAIEHGTAARVEAISFFTGACLIATELGVDARLVAWADYDPEAMASWARDRGCVGVATEGFILDPRIVTPIKDAGLSISVGAVNTIGQMERLLPLALDILVSDRPRELADELDALLAGRPRSAQR